MLRKFVSSNSVAKYTIYILAIHQVLEPIVKFLLSPYGTQINKNTVHFVQVIVQPILQRQSKIINQV